VKEVLGQIPPSGAARMTLPSWSSTVSFSLLNMAIVFKGFFVTSLKGEEVSRGFSLLPPANKLGEELLTQIFERVDGVGLQVPEPHSVRSLQSGGECLTHVLLGHFLQEHVGCVDFNVVYWILGSIIHVHL
jgi:hypothetical protein